MKKDIKLSFEGTESVKSTKHSKLMLLLNMNLKGF